MEAAVRRRRARPLLNRRASRLPHLAFGHRPLPRDSLPQTCPASSWLPTGRSHKRRVLTTLLPNPPAMTTAAHVTTKVPIMAMSSCSRLWQWKTYRPRKPLNWTAMAAFSKGPQIDRVLPTDVVRAGPAASSRQHLERVEMDVDRVVEVADQSPDLHSVESRTSRRGVRAERFSID